MDIPPQSLTHLFANQSIFPAVQQQCNIQAQIKMKTSSSAPNPCVPSRLPSKANHEIGLAEEQSDELKDDTTENNEAEQD